MQNCVELFDGVVKLLTNLLLLKIVLDLYLKRIASAPSLTKGHIE